MKLGLVGVGGAGGRIVDRIREQEKATARNFTGGNILAFDTAAPDRELRAIPNDQRIRIGDTHRKLDGAGADGDVDLAAEVTEEELYDIRRTFDFVTMRKLEGLLLVAGLGGGTGAGTSPVVLEALQEMYEKPVYVLGILPHREEGDRPALNAARSLKSLVPAADNTILFDNDAWCDPEAEEFDYGAVNAGLATRVGSLLGAGELEDAEVAENVVDSSDIIRTLSPGGVSSIGYAVTETERPGLLGRLLGPFRRDADGEATDPTEIQRLVRRAVDSELTVPCGVTSAERTLIVLSGPPSKLSRRGFEAARHWLEEETETVEVLAGDEPNDRASELSASVLLSNVTDVPRVEELQERAVAYQDAQSAE